MGDFFAVFAVFFGDRVDDPFLGDRVFVGDLGGTFALAGAFDFVGDLHRGGDFFERRLAVAGRGGERSRFVVSRALDSGRSASSSQVSMRGDQVTRLRRRYRCRLEFKKIDFKTIFV